MLKPKSTPERIPVVDKQAFNKLACNRCGECCRILRFGQDYGSEPDDEGRVGWWRHQGPLGFLELYVYFEKRGAEFASFPMEWFGQLIPSFVDGNWRYECQYLIGDECSIYKARPDICSDFPYGRPVATYPGCVWNVTLIDYDVVQWAGETLPLT